MFWLRWNVPGQLPDLLVSGTYGRFWLFGTVGCALAWMQPSKKTTWITSVVLSTAYLEWKIKSNPWLCSGVKKGGRGKLLESQIVANVLHSSLSPYELCLRYRHLWGLVLVCVSFLCYFVFFEDLLCEMVSSSFWRARMCQLWHVLSFLPLFLFRRTFSSYILFIFFYFRSIYFGL